MKNIDEIKVIVNRLTVEDLEHYTILQLVQKLILKINELADSNNEIVDTLVGLLTDGLKQDVVDQLTQWLNDGTLSDIISDDVLVEINARIETMNNRITNEVSDLNNRITNEVSDLNNKIAKTEEFLPVLPKPIPMQEATLSPAQTVNSFVADLLCNMPYDTRFNNYQGLAVFNGFLYVGEESRTAANTTYIHKMGFGGEIVETKQNSFGHIASISYSNLRNRFYIASGGQVNNTVIWEYDFETNAVTATLDLSYLQKNALVAVDNGNNNLILLTCAEYKSPITIYTVSFTGEILKSIDLPSYGVPQGISVYNNQIYYMTGENGIEGYLQILDLDGNLIQRNVFYKERAHDANPSYSNEPQGIEVASLYGAPAIFMLWANPGRVYIKTNHESHMFSSIDLYGSASSHHYPGTTLLPRLIPFYIKWNKAAGQFEEVVSDNILSSSTNLFASITAEMVAQTSGYSGIEIKLTPRIIPTAFINCSANTTTKYGYLGYTIFGNMQYLNQYIRLGVMKNGKAITLDNLDDGLEIFGYVLVSMRLSK